MKKKISKTTYYFSLYGVFMWFLYYVFASMIILKDLTISTPSIDAFYSISEFFFPIPHFFTIAIFYYALFGLLYFLAGHQCIKGRTSGFFWYISLGFLHIITGILGVIFFYGFISNYSVLYNILIGLVIIFYFTGNKVKKEFNLSNKVISNINNDIKRFKYIIFFIILIYSIFSLLMFFNYPLVYKNIEKKDYTEDISEYDYNIKLFDINMNISKDVVLGNINFLDEKPFYYTLINTEKKYGISVYDYTYFEKMKDVIGSKFKIKDISDFIEIVFNNKISVLSTLIKTYKFNNSYHSFSHIKSIRQNRKIFMASGKKGNKNFYEFFVYNMKNKKMFSVTFANVSDNKSNELKDFERIIQNTYFTKNEMLNEKMVKVVDLINRRDYEKAKFIISDMIYKQPENSEYYFLMALCFQYSELSNPEIAYKYLKRALKLNPEHEKAKKMLLNIK